MGAEEQGFTIGDSVDAINEKLVRRHPHIFGEETAHTGDEVLKGWDQIKALEKKQKAEKPQGLLDGVPRAMPALAEAQQIASRAAGRGFDWSNAGEVMAKLD